jgi:hypothetical protein
MKKSSRFIGLMLMLLGATLGGMLLLNILGKPRVEGMRGSDVVKLVGSVVCFGIGFVRLMGK